jgi:hypothetical protein
MRRAVAPVAVLVALGGVAHAKPTPRGGTKPPPAPPHVYVRPAPPLPMLPGIARVRVEAARDHVVVLEEVSLPRGDWQAGGLDLYVAFGAPGTPSAVDARLVPVPTGATEARADDVGEPVAVEPVVRHTPGSQPLLGRPSMAGVVLHVKGTQLVHAYGLGDVAALRVRSLLPAPAAEAGGVRDVVVRLGIAGGAPLTLGKVQVVSLEPTAWITRAEATLCGPEADPWPLSLTLSPKPADPPPFASPTIAPSMAVRHASDDLCIRWWAAP